jgi:hypothetical protein
VTEPIMQRYATASAFLAAVDARVRAAAAGSLHSISELRRQFAYERFLARVFASTDSPWVLKGAASLLVRLPVARHSLDIDLFRAAAQTPEAAAGELRALAVVDLADYFRFDVGPEQRIAQGMDGVRVAVTAHIGTRSFERFPIDIVTGCEITGPPERRTPAPVVDLSGLPPVTYQLYPLADHVTDKLCAMVETYGEGQRASTRYRDLVDLVLIARTEELDAHAVRTAVEHEFHRRGLPRLETVPVPSPTWAAGYAAAARRMPSLDGYATLDAAMDLVRRLLDPVLQGRTDGRWSPHEASWATP